MAVRSRRNPGRDRDDGPRRGRGRRSGTFEYHQRSSEQTKKRQSEFSGRGVLKDADTPRFTPKKGKNRIRILPPTWEGAEHCGLDVYVHYEIGPENSAVASLQKMLGEPDPIWEEYQKAREEGDDAYTKKLRPNHRVAYWVIDRDNEKEGPQLWMASWYAIDQELAALMIDEDTGGVINIDDPNDGYDITFIKEGERDRTQYKGISIARRSSDLGRNGEDWLEYIQEKPIPELIDYLSYDEIEDLFHGKRGDDEDKGRSHRGRSRGGRDTEEEEENNELSWEEVHEMTWRKLEKLVIDEDLSIDSDDEDFDSDQEFADAICEHLEIAAPRTTRRDERGAKSGRTRGRNHEEEDEEEDDRHARHRSRRRGREEEKEEEEEDGRPRRRTRR